MMLPKNCYTIVLLLIVVVLVVNLIFFLFKKNNILRKNTEGFVDLENAGRKDSTNFMAIKEMGWKSPPEKLRRQGLSSVINYVESQNITVPGMSIVDAIEQLNKHIIALEADMKKLDQREKDDVGLLDNTINQLESDMKKLDQREKDDVGLLVNTINQLESDMINGDKKCLTELDLELNDFKNQFHEYKIEVKNVRHSDGGIHRFKSKNIF